MPLGFQFLPSPDREKRCDLTDCPVSGNVPWKILKHAEQMAFYIKFIAVRDWTVNPTPFDAVFVVHV